nr:MAG TPA: hypothetical protein [Caudoviricetes sp.]DAY42245.1 MAG TPA: hypothetical protein [Caudoviricetes sp.]
MKYLQYDIAYLILYHEVLLQLYYVYSIMF